MGAGSLTPKIQYQQHQRARHRRPQDHLAHRPVHPAQCGNGKQCATQCSGVIHSAMKAVGKSMYLRMRAVRQQRVARRIAQTLAGAIQAAQQQQRTPTRHQAQQRTRQIGQAIAEHHQLFSSSLLAVRITSRPQLENARCRIRHSFHQTQNDRSSAQHRGDQYRDKRRHHLRSQVVKKTDQADRDHGGRQFMACHLKCVMLVAPRLS